MGDFTVADLIIPGRWGGRIEAIMGAAVTSPWAVDLVGRVGVGPGARVLDRACGTGLVARIAAGASRRTD